MLQRLPIQRHSDPVFGDIVLGTGCRKGNSLRELRVRATLRPTRNEPGSRPAPGRGSGGSTRKARGRRAGCRAASTQARADAAEEVIPATLSVAYTFAPLKTLLVC